MEKILIVLDGCSGLPHPALGGKTPLEAAKTPNLDFFASKAKLGHMYPLNKKQVPGSDNALISIFGNNPQECKRGVYEAIGAGLKLNRGDLALRTNFGTIDNLKNRKVIDRRAGRTLTTQEAEKLGKTLNKKIKLGCRFEFKPTIQHRGTLVLRGGFCDSITDIDTEWTTPGTKEKKFRYSRALNDDEICKHTANKINTFIDQTFNILNNHPINLKRKKKGLFPANMIFMRGAGSEIPKIKQFRSWMSINSMPLEIGIAILSGMKNFSFKYPEMKSIDVYKNLYKSLNTSIKFAIKTIKKNHDDFLGCYIQFKETDIPGHDNKPLEKKKMIEIIDKKFFGFLRKFTEKNSPGRAGGKGLKVVVTCDHSTPCKLKAHSAHPVPVLVYESSNTRNPRKFTEVEGRKGELGKIPGRKFMEKTGLR